MYQQKACFVRCFLYTFPPPPPPPQYIYYADNTRGLIAQVSLSTAGVLTEQVLITNRLGLVQGLAVDWVSGNVLFSDSMQGTIMQYHPASNTTTSVLTGLQQPKTLVLYPYASYRSAV